MRGRALAAAGWVLCGGCTQLAPPAVSARAIVGGTATTGDPAVVALIAQVPGAALATLCTATIVSPHVVLTAAHCVSPDAVGATAKFRVGLAPNLDTARAKDFVDVTEVHYHPDFSLSKVTGGNDIAVAIVGSPLAPKPIAMNQSALSSSLVGQPARMVGYGKTAGSDTSGASAGLRREADTVMGAYDDKLVRFGVAGTTTCEGDSGGPGLMTIAGQEVIVGVVSFGDQDCAMLDADTRVDRYVDDWIRPYVDDADPGFFTPLPTKDSGCAMATGAFPSPFGATLVFALGALALRRRRRDYLTTTLSK